MVEEKFRVPAGADLGEGPLPGWQDAAAFPLCPRWWGLRTLESSSLVDPTWTPPPNDITLRVWDLVWLLLPGESVFTAMYCRQPQAKGTAPLTCWTHEFSGVTYRSVDEGLTMLLCFFDTWPLSCSSGCPQTGYLPKCTRHHAQPKGLQLDTLLMPSTTDTKPKGTGHSPSLPTRQLLFDLQ